MPRYVGLGRYSAAGAAGARKDGFATREAQARGLVDSLGGKLESWSWLRSDNWDFMFVMDAPSEAPVAMNLISKPTGLFERAEIMELLSSADVDRIAGTLDKAVYSPPGTVS